MNTQFTDADRTVFIPSVELVGTREAKLLQLDGVLSQLNATRRTLAGGAPRPTVLERPGRHESSARGWWAAGVVVGALFALLAIGAWAKDASVDQSPARTAAVVYRAY